MSEETSVPVETSEVQDQTNEVETAPEPTPEPQPGPAATQLQQLLQTETSKREAEVQQAERARREAQLDQLAQLARTDPEKFFEIAGGDKSRLQKNKAKPSELEQLRAEVSRLKEGWTERQQREQQLVRQAELERVRRSVHSFVDTSEDFPLTKAAGMSDAVYDTLLNYHQSNQPISEAEAARQVEENLVGLIEKALSVEAIRSRFLKTQSENGDDSLSLSTITDSSTTPRENSYRSEQEELDAFASLLKFT